MLENKFNKKGRMSFVIGGQWGSEGKGAAAAWLARQVSEAGDSWDIITTNAGAQAGHTSVHNGKTVVVNHLPTAAIIAAEYGHFPLVYLNAGSIIDPVLLEKELNDHPTLKVMIHPNAAIIDDRAREAEMAFDSTVTKIASTRKGVGQAYARKALRFPEQIAREHPVLQSLVHTIDLNHQLQSGASAFCEVPQGVSLGINTPFYPHTTSRTCSVGQAISDADLHPSFAGHTMLVLRSMPIRVGNIMEDGREVGNSGGHYRDQSELSWEDLGLTPEITTVTKRIRRIFTFSRAQAYESMNLTRPSAVFMTFCDYIGPEASQRWLGSLMIIAKNLGLDFTPVFGVGPSTDDVTISLEHWQSKLMEARA